MAGRKNDRKLVVGGEFSLLFWKGMKRYLDASALQGATFMRVRSTEITDQIVT